LLVADDSGCFATYDDCDDLAIDAVQTNACIATYNDCVQYYGNDCADDETDCTGDCTDAACDDDCDDTYDDCVDIYSVRSP